MRISGLFLQRAAIAVTLGGAALLAASCGGGGGGAGSPTARAVLTDTRERAGIRIEVSIDSATYKSGEGVHVKATATNISGAPITYGSPAGQPVFTIAINSELGGIQVLNPGSTSPAAGETMEKGESVSAEATWDQTLDLPQWAVPAPAGHYAANAELVVAGQGGAPLPVGAGVGFDLEEGEAIIAPQDAMQAALAAPEVKAWFDGRAQTPVCAYPPRGLFYIANVATGKVNESLDVLYNANQSNGYPICSIFTSEEGWWILLYGRDGPAPNRIMAWVDFHSGAFIRMEEGGPTPVPATPNPTPTPTP